MNFFRVRWVGIRSFLFPFVFLLPSFPLSLTYTYCIFTETLHLCFISFSRLLMVRTANGETILSYANFSCCIFFFFVSFFCFLVGCYSNDLPIDSVRTRKYRKFARTNIMRPRFTLNARETVVSFMYSYRHQSPSTIVKDSRLVLSCGLCIFTRATNI